MDMRVVSKLMLLLMVGVAFSSGCAVAPALQTAARVDQPRYAIDVFPTRPPLVSRDGFDAGLSFSVTADGPLRHQYLVQELHQVLVYEFVGGGESRDSFSLVECFRLREAGETMFGTRYELEHGQYDRHFHKGLLALGAEVKAVRVERTVRAYLADVRGADFTRRGFAQLECNEDGSVVTNSPAHFNAGYRAQYETRGRPMLSNLAGGVIYRIEYRLERMGLGNAEFEITRFGGNGRVFQPSFVLRQ
jgi:hypothetical protein